MTDRRTVTISKGRACGPTVGVEGLPLALLAELPLACTLTAEVTHPTAGTFPVLLTTSRARAASAAREGVACCTPLEFEAIAATLEAGCVTPERVLELLARKTGVRPPTITLEKLVGVVRFEHGRRKGRPVHTRGQKRPLLMAPGAARQLEAGTSWTIGEFLAALDARLVEVCVEGREGSVRDE